MTQAAFLDTSVLGLATKRRGVPEAEACRAWLARCLQSGVAIYVPAIAYYEVRRELERAKNEHALARLDAFCAAVPNRYVVLTDSALRLASRLWAEARQAGTPTADPKELDCDVLIAAQALDFGLPPTDFVIATENVGHLSRFVPAQLWPDLVP